MSQQPLKSSQQPAAVAQAAQPNRFLEWIQDPMGSAIAASIATISAFGLVLAGMWLVDLALK